MKWVNNIWHVNKAWLQYADIYEINYPFHVIRLGPGGRLNKKDGLTRYGNPMLKIRRPNGRLIFNMEIAIHR